MVELLVTGVVLLAIAVMLLHTAYQQTRLARQAAATPQTPIAELQALHERVAAQIGSDLFAQRVALTGVLECAEPLSAPLSGIPCAAFRYRVTRRWEEEYETRDDKGEAVPTGAFGKRHRLENEREDAIPAC